MRRTIALHDSLFTVRSCVCVIRRSSMRAVRVVCQWCVCVVRVLSEPVGRGTSAGGRVVILDPTDHGISFASFPLRVGRVADRWGTMMQR